MAMKDWKKVGNDRWKKGGTSLSVYKSSGKFNGKDVFHVRVGGNYGYRNIVSLTNKTATLRYAKSYMRKH